MPGAGWRWLSGPSREALSRRRRARPEEIEGQGALEKCSASLRIYCRDQGLQCLNPRLGQLSRGVKPQKSRQQLNGPLKDGKGRRKGWIAGVAAYFDEGTQRADCT